MNIRVYLAAQPLTIYNHGQTLDGPSIAIPAGAIEIGLIALTTLSPGKATWLEFAMQLNQSLDGGQNWSSLEHVDKIIGRPEFVAPSGIGQSSGNFAGLYGNCDILVPDDSWSYWTYSPIPGANFMSASIALRVIQTGAFNSAKMGLAYIAKNQAGDFIDFDESTVRPA